MYQSSYEKLGEAKTSTIADGVAPLTGNPIVVIDRQFCAPNVIDLVVESKVTSSLTDDSFAVRDVNGNTLFKMKANLSSVRLRRALVDATGSPILSVQRKLLSTRDRWKVFKGDSKATEDLIFSVERSSTLQMKTNLNVFLASNTTEASCDFKIKGSWFDKSLTIYNGNTDTPIAQIHMKVTASSLMKGKDNFMVTVCPNVDYAFVVAVILILDAINREGAGAV